MENLTVSASPHITNNSNSTRAIMLDVVIALMAPLIAATYYYGYHVIINAVVCCAACFGFELLFSLIFKKDFSKKGVKTSSAFDCSCLVTGMILALNLPAKTVVPQWDWNVYKSGFNFINSVNAPDNILFSLDTIIVCIVGSLFAIALVKLLFGGIGKNFANPAATARIFLMLAFGLGVCNATGLGVAASSGATWLGGDKSTSGSIMLNMFIGNRGTCAAGEACMVALIVSYAYLSIRKIIDFRAPLIIIGSAAVFFFIFDGLIKQGYRDTRLITNTLTNIMAGGLVFASIFMATDYSTTPNTFIGNVIFGVGFALITVIIRVFAGAPEGVSYALVIMNVITPILDKYIIPKPFSYIKRVKKPKVIKEA